MTDEVASYATQGLRLWAARQGSHGERCPCLICADTRAYLKPPPLDVRSHPVRRAS